MDAAHLARFRADLIGLSPAEMFEKYVEPAECFGIPEMDEGALRHAIADNFEVSQSCIMIVGSAKLGFTLQNKEPTYEEDEPRPAFSPMGPQSDVDVAIVSDTLFDSIWKRCLELTDTSGYVGPLIWPRAKSFQKYMFKGWIRPDNFPLETGLPLRSEWFTFFRGIARNGMAAGYPITGGIYRERYFLERYQMRGIKEARKLEETI